MFNYALILEYDGSAFAGFQIQPESPTVQGTLESALNTVFREPVRVHCSGRTDTGVHASGQVVSFTAPRVIEEPSRFLISVNALTDRGVSARALTPVPDDFHARFSCLAREYEYLIWNSNLSPCHWRGKALWVRRPLPLAELNDELQSLVGELDFQSFTRAEYADEVTFRYIDRISISAVEDPLSRSNNLFSFRIRGNAFLHNMIRIIVGTLVDRAADKLKQNLSEILAARSRIAAGQTAPPDGLFFRHAYYTPSKDYEFLETVSDYPVYRKPRENSA